MGGWGYGGLGLWGFRVLGPTGHGLGYEGLGLWGLRAYGGFGA